MGRLLDLDQHFSITSANQVKKIVAPLAQYFDIKHFRYLKLYANNSRILLSNFTDCIRFVYEEGHYKKMWFDGEFPEYLKAGCYCWDIVRFIDTDKTLLEREINRILGLYHGMTFVYPGFSCWEIYTFDSDDPAVYFIDKKVLTRFILYFKEQAIKLIEQGESEKIFLSRKETIKKCEDDSTEKVTEFLKKTSINRYYLNGKYSDVFLTKKEIKCVYWLIQGKSVEEIAIIDNKSTKTIHRHLENVRKKLDCYKQTQIVRIILESGILNSIH